jgi:phage terminase large subunit-like protein
MPLIVDKLRDSAYIPSSVPGEQTAYRIGTKEVCPVSFTENIIEYCESEHYLGAHLRELQKDFLNDLFSLDSTGYPRYDTGVIIAGMRGGKSMMAAMIASFILHKLLAMDTILAKRQITIDSKQLDTMIINRLVSISSKQRDKKS